LMLANSSGGIWSAHKVLVVIRNFITD